MRIARIGVACAACLLIILGCQGGDSHRVSSEGAMFAHYMKAAAPTATTDSTNLIAYTVEDASTGNSSIWVANADGTNPRKLTDGTAHDSHPAITFAGGSVIFQSDRAGLPMQLFGIMMSGTDLRQITTMGGESPAVSPDGNLTAFTTARGGTNNDIYVYGLGENPTQITSGMFDEVDPCFSADSARIAFASHGYLYYDEDYEEWTEYPEIHSITVASPREEVRLTESFGAYNPAYSPDGKYLAYASARYYTDQDLRDLYLKRLDIVMDYDEWLHPPEWPTNTDAPNFSADSTRMAYTLDAEDDPEIWRYNLNAGYYEYLLEGRDPCYGR